MRGVQLKGDNWFGFIVWTAGSLSVFFFLASIPGWIFNSGQLLDLESIRIELFAFIIVMAIGDIAKSSSKNVNAGLYDAASWASVSLFVILAVIPEYFDRVFERSDSSQILPCILNSLARDSDTDKGYFVVFLLLIVGITCSLYTAFRLRSYGQKIDLVEKEYSGFNAFLMVLIASVMLSVYFFLKYLHVEPAVHCSNIQYSRVVLLAEMSILATVIFFTMATSRCYVVYALVPFCFDDAIGIRGLLNFLIWIFALLMVVVIALYFRDYLLINPIYLIVFLFLVCYVIAVILRVLKHWKNHYLFALLVFTVSLAAVGAGFFFGVYLKGYSGEELIEIQLDEDTIEYLNKQ